MLARNASTNSVLVSSNIFRESLGGFYPIYSWLSSIEVKGSFFFLASSNRAIFFSIHFYWPDTLRKPFENTSINYSPACCVRQAALKAVSASLTRVICLSFCCWSFKLASASYASFASAEQSLSLSRLISFSRASLALARLATYFLRLAVSSSKILGLVANFYS